MSNKKILTIILIGLMLVVATFVYCSTYPFKNPEFATDIDKFREKDYVEAYCKGQIEYKLKDKTRVDCLTDEYAIEFDWGKKWAESIGQSLYYAKMTGKKPAVALIIKSPKELIYAKRIELVDKNIKVFVIKSNDYQASGALK